jgi:GAF domain-containing protein
VSHAVRLDRPAAKADRYAELAGEIASVLEGEPNLTARMATVASMLADAFESYFWAGFYVVDPDKPQELVVGPYQGTLGCLRIPFGRGVCGAAAAERRTVIVPDVHAFQGHIACDSRSNSEIVVPGVRWRRRAHRRVRRGLDGVIRLRGDRCGVAGADPQPGLRRLTSLR